MSTYREVTVYRYLDRVDCPESAAPGSSYHLVTMAKVHSFGASPISCHAWSGSRSELALSHNTKDVTLYTAGQCQGFEVRNIF